MSLVQVKGSTWDAEENVLIDLVSDLGSVLEQEGLIVTRGHTSINDGGGGSFIFDGSVARNTADNGTIIDPTGSGSGNGCWLRIYTLSNYSLRFFGSDDSSTNNLNRNYGIEGATVNISSNDGGTFIYDHSERNNGDGINNYDGWIRVDDHHIRNDLEAITGIVKLGDGVYENGKSYVLPEHYLIDEADHKAYIPALNLNLPYSVNTGSYPTANSDPNLIFVSAKSIINGGLQEEQVTLSDGQLTVSFSLSVDSAQFYITGMGRLEAGQYSVNIGPNEIDLVESYPAGTKVTLTNA